MKAAGVALTVAELGEVAADVYGHGPVEVRFTPDEVAAQWTATVIAAEGDPSGLVLEVLMERDDEDAVTEFIAELVGCGTIAEVRNVLDSARTYGELKRYFR